MSIVKNYQNCQNVGQVMFLQLIKSLHLKGRSRESVRPSVSIESHTFSMYTSYFNDCTGIDYISSDNLGTSSDVNTTSNISRIQELVAVLSSSDFPAKECLVVVNKIVRYVYQGKLGEASKFIQMLKAADFSD